MRSSNLELMKKGWFVGNFDPSVYKTENVEVSVKSFKKGEREESHYHKIATEITVVVVGKVRMFSKTWGSGAIIIAEPGDKTDFEALIDSVLTVVKIPGVLNDKYIE